MSEQKQRVYDALNKLGIKYEVVEHEPVHTMEDMDRLGLPEKGTLCKNLFLRDAKGKRHFLITCDENTVITGKEKQCIHLDTEQKPRSGNSGVFYSYFWHGKA